MNNNLSILDILMDKKIFTEEKIWLAAPCPARAKAFPILPTQKVSAHIS